MGPKKQKVMYCVKYAFGYTLVVATSEDEAVFITSFSFIPNLSSEDKLPVHSQQ